jgi:hypothetical protein
MITDTDLRQIATKYKIPVNDIFMKDQPPLKIKYGGYIINLDDESLGRGGTHFVSLWIPKYPKQDIIYYDTFGFAVPQSIINWIRLRGGIYKKSRIVYNDKHIQNVNSGGCGIYSLFFINFMARHKSIYNSIALLEKYNNLWSDDTKNNLNLLKEYVPYYKNSII